MILLDPAALEARRKAVGGPLRPLLDSLSSELEGLVGRDPYLPPSKALLSRAGGRCEIDGATLDFDPFAPEAHRCPTCGTRYSGELHHRAWITSYQLWIAERAVHAALFNLFRPDARHAQLGRDILRAYADRYLEYPNVDNVLGPTRLFFSTYLESIWLLQICVAADLLQAAGDGATAELVRDRIVEPSRALIAEYDEGMSNRQVWNNAALLAAAALCGDDAAFDARLAGTSGLEAHLDRALLRDGTWYEGENYHQFALRGLWYGVVLAEARGRDLAPTLVERFGRAFGAPFITALPDFTMPSRKDSQYAVSLRQWRLAELTELGFARTGDATLGLGLGRCYETGHARVNTGRSRSTADVERNGPSGALTRADLGWRALLHALPELPELPVGSVRSALLEEQGLAVFRRSGDVFVGLDFGQSGGGHGHPDRLNLLLSHGATRWLDDLGTGSYVDPSLHWYRSTLAHNAPLCDGRSQELRDGVLLAHEEREGMGWVRGAFAERGVSFERTVVVAPDYLIDELRWTSSRDTRIDLPVHLDASADCSMSAMALEGGQRPSDGFAFVGDARVAHVPAAGVVRMSASRDARSIRVFAAADRPFQLFNVEGPGQPVLERRRFHVCRFETTATPGQPDSGVLRTVYTWTDDVCRVDLGPSTTIELRDGERHVHTASPDGWHVQLQAGGARSSIDLTGARRQPSPKLFTSSPRQPAILRRASALPKWLGDAASGARTNLLVFDLGRDHYRRSEQDWDAAGKPRATVALAADQRGLIVYVLVTAGDPRFASPDAANLYDNEHADTMGAGLQLYLRTPAGEGAWTLVPELGGAVVRARAIGSGGALVEPEARWRSTANAGYELRILVPLPDFQAHGEYPLDLDLLVNETTAGRERRRGQLVLSGALGEFVYLRGDRHDAERMIPLVVVA